MSPSTTGFSQILTALLAIVIGLAFAAPAVRAGAATPVAAPVWGCDAPLRSQDEITLLLATPATPEPEPEWSGVLPMGEPLRPDEQIQVETAARRFVACSSAGEPIRLYSLYTDRYLLRLLSRESSPVDAAWSDTQATPSPVGPDNGAELVEITGGRRMADGRLGALITIVFPAKPQPTTFFFTFLPQGDHVLIDDILRVPTVTQP